MLYLPTRFVSLLTALILVICSQAMASDLPPMVTSYAEKPVQGFNRQVEAASKQDKKWVRQAESISQHYAGSQFKLVRTVPHGNVSVSYLTRIDQHHHKQILMILMLEQSGKHWRLNKAMVSWQCKKGQHFSTDPCH
ncbi:hypothetical protein L2725_06475 [Shewanella corallii]|uniref:Uncharacterized protein n=1 Tax=Shewanella corallii TaxID=560080 RepID=A0ABT0N4T8_9GAMM|nr:hypothetical protein [Shewanella corallii]MCL2913433.1 hypothetical protein [Shewanella corallii]